MDLSKVIRKNILALAPYSCARDEFKGEASVFIDANESPYENGVNRYPDPLQHEVKVLLSQLKKVSEEQIFLGNGSDEAIDLVYRIFCEPRIDNVVAIAPSYGMYKVCADVNDVEYRSASLTDDFQLDLSAISSKVDDKTKVLWICSPNNPSGNAFSLNELELTFPTKARCCLFWINTTTSSFSRRSARHGDKLLSVAVLPTPALRLSCISIV